MAAAGLGAGLARAEDRSLSFFNTHTSERATITFKRNGQYDPAGLKQLNYLLRDWRQNREIRMDPELFDLIWEVYRETGASEPINIVCGYRAPETNNMLRSRSRGVAKHSQHMLGKAMDFFIPGVDLTKLRLTGMKKQYGGVGIYYGSNFVHMDVGSVRTWPNRLSRDQLLALFPDGKTLHLPADGNPLPGYQLALAEFNRKHPNRGSVEWDDEDEVSKPVALSNTVVAKADVAPPAPPPDPVTRIGGDVTKPAPGSLFKPAAGLFASAMPPEKPDVAASRGPIAPQVATLFAMPKSKPGAAAAPADIPQQPVKAASPNRPSPSAVDALTALAGGETGSIKPTQELAYAPQPRAWLNEQADAVATGRQGRTIVSPGAGGAARSTAPAAQKSDRGDPLARLVARVQSEAEPAALHPVTLKGTKGSDNLVRTGTDGLDTFLAKPSRIVVAGFSTTMTRPIFSFAGPAIVALNTHTVE